jgi:hypothetical protein
MSNDSNRAAAPDAGASSSGQILALNDLDQALNRQMEPFLQRMKQITLEVIDEVAQKHGSPLVAQLRQTLVETVGVIVRAQVPAILDQLRPSVREGGDTFRKNADSMAADLKQFISKTVVEVFREHVPTYSRWAGQRIIDYFLAGTLFCLAAVLLCVGTILGLEKAGLPAYLTYLVGGGVAVGVGAAFLKLRSRRWGNAGSQRPIDPPAV